ncbi:hypothetical protein REPUB_Repub03eG0166900 [Reevesia pubescens]
MDSHKEMQRPEGNDDDDLSLLESGLYRTSYSDMGDNHHRIQERAMRLGKSIDPRLLVLLEFFKEFYVRRKELLKKIFPGHQNEFLEFLGKVGRVLVEVKSNHVQVKTMQRSLSLGSPRTPSKNGDEPPLRLQRFKIRTINFGDVQEGGRGGQGGQGEGATKPADSK